MTDQSARLMKPEEVATLFGVEANTVVRWARAGRLRSTKTPGGQWRIYASEMPARETLT
ncbi:helix-turn-helix domain-containing protein [Streptosporangium saharense]|uniref:helix-turn-helix domain-containing protein n=1 Tax=Streptosporangium saharense TaxID=1706840 RepID=UPI0033258CB4